MLAAAFVLIQFDAWRGPVEVLPRPLLAAALFAMAIQALATVVLRDRDRGAHVALFAVLLAIGPAIAALALVAYILVGVLLAVRRRRGAAPVRWRRSTTILNAVGAVLLVTSVSSVALAGALWPAGGTDRAERGNGGDGLPDLYVVLLDGYPRADTLATDLGLDNGSFLQAMGGLGFDLAPRSRANYPMTLATLASMLNARQLPAMVPDPPDDIAAQYRLLTRLINEASETDALRAAGYEIVSVPSEFTEAALLSADRVLDSGQMTTFEMALVESGTLGLVGAGESLILDHHRERVRASFRTLGELAAERDAAPKLVLAHILAPHPPIAFSRTGEAAPPLACPTPSCSPFSFGDEYGERFVGPMRDQIGWLNDTVLATVREIQSRSERPPVIVMFSDHGLRTDPTDRDEMFRTLFLASTPGRTAVFPDDVTPVNLIARLRNAYTGGGAALATEESYWVDPRAAPTLGVFPGPRQPVP